jgi:hypothetical protein
MKRGWLKNTALATILSTTLTACGGGGGGGGAIGVVDDFVNDDLSNLSGSASLVSSYSNLLSDFQSVVSSGDISAIQGVITGPDENDIAQANTLLTQLATAQTLWAQTEDLINNQSDAEKYTIYNSDAFKQAHAAMLYLQNYVKPVIQKVANGQTITLADYNLVDKQERATEIIEQEKNSTSSDYANTKKIKSTETISNDTATDTDTTGTSSVSYTDWETVYAGGGDEQRTKTTTTTNLRTTVVTRCTFERTTLLNGYTSDGAQTCTEISSATTELDPTLTTETETRAGDNPVVTTVALDDVVTTETEQTDPYTVTTYVDAENTTTETEEGSATTNTANRDVTTTTDHGDNTSTVTVIRYVDTTTTTPTTTRTYRTRHYTDVVKKDTRTITTTTPVNRVTYKDGTTEDINGSSTVTTGEWTTVQVSQSQRSENILQSEQTTDVVVTTSDAGTQLSSQSVSNAYTDNDINLGTPTENMSTVVADHKTAEYNSNSGLNTINAADAYARGWTGEGAVLGVIDTWQDTDHEKLDGKYLFYKDYDPYNDTVTESQGHGTFVASIIAGKRDGDSLDENGRLTTGDYRWDGVLNKNNDMHGVAFDAKLVGANVDRYSRGSIDKGQAQNALHDFAKLKSPESEGGEEMNIVAVNMSFNTPQLFYDNNGSTVTQLSDGTYNASEIISKIQANGAGDARYWKVATDNDIILVNSAGNYGFSHSGDPGIWAVEEDLDGNLVLGGKMVIVGNWDGSSVAGNKAGHVCLKIDTTNNTCNDTHRLSEFYILAPGTNITSAISNDRYTKGSGTSFAAPHVTGAFGVLNQMWPYMKGENLVKLVMNTADKNLPGYDVNTHGQGLLDLNEATKPQGAVGIVTTGRVDHPTVSINNTYFSTGTALPSGLENLKIMVLDDYDRNYYMDIGSTFVVKDKRKYSDVDRLSANADTFLPMNQMYGSFAQGGQWDLVRNYNFGFYTGENGNGDYSTNIGKNFFITDNLKFKTSVGVMSEQETWLGNSSDGVLAVGDNNDTNFGNIGVDYQIGNNVLSLDYTRGKTDINTVDDSLIKSFSDVETESYRLAYEIHKDKHNTLGWSFSLPSHITSGTMDLEVAESVNLDGTINYETIRSDLTQSTKEKNIGFYLNHTPEHDTDAAYNFTAEYRQDVAGESGRDGINLAMNYTKRFWGSCKFLWMKNPKCYTKDENGKDVLTAENKALMFGHNNTDPATKLGLRYDLKTDMFVPINPEDEKWKQ